MSGYHLVDGKPVMDVGKMPVEDLRKIVLGIVGGSYFVSAQAPDDLLSSIFMPLMFGALSIPDDVCKELTGSDPPEMKKYVPEESPKCADLPPEPQLVQNIGPLLEIDPEKTRDFNFGDLTEEEYAAHVAYVAAENLRIKNEFDRENASLKAKKKAWRKEVERIKEAHAKAMLEYAAAESLRMEEYLKSCEQADAWRIRKQELFSEWLADVGVLGEDISNANPRSINGYPIFFSMRLIHKDDWARIRVAVQRELKARDELDV